MSKHLAPIFAYNGIQGNGFVSPRVYGAKGDKSADDTTALQAAIDAAKLFNGGLGGTVVLDGAFRITGTLTMDSRVSLIGVGAGGSSTDGSAIFMDHATNGILSWTTQGSFKHKARISNLLLAGIQPNTGTVLNFTGGLLMNLLLDNVTLNQSVSAGKLNGRFYGFNGTAGRLALRNCRLHASGTAVTLIAMDSSGADLSIDHCEISTADNRTANVLDLSTGQYSVTDTEFLAGNNPSGYWLDLGASAVGKSCRNTFYNLDTAIVVAHHYAAGAILIAKDNYYDPYTYPTPVGGGGGVLLGDGSKLELLPYLQVAHNGTSASLNSIYDMLSYTESSTSAPTYALPTIQYKGQRFKFNLKNASGSTWTPAFSGSYLQLATIPSMAGGGGLATFTFEAIDATPGTFTWYLTGVGHT